MSFVVGALSGALVASGIYYAVFSRDLETRTARHRQDLQAIVGNFREPQVPAPPSAASRIRHDSRSTFLKQRWNEEIEGIFLAVKDFDTRAIEWGRRIIGDKGPR